jgi:hypothetical protein
MRLTRFRGDNYPINVTFQENNRVINVTNAIAKLSYKADGTDQFKTITGQVVNGPSGRVSFFPEPDDFQDVGVFRYDIELDRAGIITTFVQDKIVIKDDITKN